MLSFRALDPETQQGATTTECRLLSPEAPQGRVRLQLSGNAHRLHEAHQALEHA